MTATTTGVRRIPAQGLKLGVTIVIVTVITLMYLRQMLLSRGIVGVYIYLMPLEGD